MKLTKWHITPEPEKPGLSERLTGLNHQGERQTLTVIAEKPLTLFLNDSEIVTNMTIGDYPEYLAAGYLFNQNIITKREQIAAIDYDEELSVVVVRTHEMPEFQRAAQRIIRTSGCAQGTIFDNMMEEVAKRHLDSQTVLRASWLLSLQKQINMQDSLYLRAGAIHGCVLCHQDTPLVYMEDVGRHNAIDKIAGFMLMHEIVPQDKIFYTTGRLTSEMVMKTIMMNIPILVSRSGFTLWGVELAREAGLTLIGRLRGERFFVLAGEQRLEMDVQRVKIDSGKSL